MTTKKDRQEIDASVRALLAQHLQSNEDPSELPSNVPIFRGGLGLDSMSAVHLMTALEEEYAVRIEDDEFDIFDSLDALVSYLCEHQGRAS